MVTQKTLLPDENLHDFGFGVGTFALLGAIKVEIIKVKAAQRQISYRVSGEPQPVTRWVALHELQPLTANVFRVGDRVQSKQQVGLTDGVIFNVIAVNGDILSLEGIGRDGKPIKTHFSKASDFELVSADKWAAWEKVLQSPAEPAASFAVGDTVTLTEKFAKSAGLSAETHYRVSSINKHGLLSLSGAGMDVPLIAPEKVAKVHLDPTHQWQVGDHASLTPEIAAQFGLDPNTVYTVSLVTPQGFISLKGLSNPASFAPQHLVFEEVVAAKDEPTPAQKAQPRNNPNISGTTELTAGTMVKTRRGRIGIVTTGESHDRLVRVDEGSSTRTHYVNTLELLPPEEAVETDWQLDTIPHMNKVKCVGYRRDEQGALDRAKDIARHLYQQYVDGSAGGIPSITGWNGKVPLYINDAYAVHDALFSSSMNDIWVEDYHADDKSRWVEVWDLSPKAALSIETLTAQRDKLLTDPVRLQVKELEVKLAAAEAARETAEKRALQHEAAMLAKVEAAQAEAEKWRDELKALELGQPVTPPPAPTVLKTEIKTLVHGLNRRAEVDLEFAQHLNEGWEVLHINTTMCYSSALGESFTERQITLKRLVQLPAFPPQPSARAAADLAEEFVAALDEPVVDPADLDTEIEEEFDPVVPISEFAITPEEKAALDKLHTSSLKSERGQGGEGKQVIILPQVRPSALDRLAPHFAQTNPLGEVIRREGVDALHEQQNAQTLAAMRAAYTNALQRTRSFPLQLTAEVEA